MKILLYIHFTRVSVGVTLLKWQIKYYFGRVYSWHLVQDVVHCIFCLLFVYLWRKAQDWMLHEGRERSWLRNNVMVLSKGAIIWSHLAAHVSLDCIASKLGRVRWVTETWHWRAKEWRLTDHVNESMSLPWTKQGCNRSGHQKHQFIVQCRALFEVSCHFWKRQRANKIVLWCRRVHVTG